jgi:SAM-dependent methyltransferase
MSSMASSRWWQKSLVEEGVRAMDKLLPGDASWSDVVASGRQDFERARQLTGLQTGPDRVAVEIGCGLGRMTAVLAEHFGRVVGLDVAPALLEAARRNITSPHVSFEVCDGTCIRPQGLAAADTVFSYEVLYLVRPAVLADYFRDVFRLLREQGEFVFQLNLEPLRWRTRLSYLVRDVLYRLGITHWRGWPTGPGFRRHAYQQEWVCQKLTEAGFVVARVVAPNRRETWFVARKPPVSAG